MQKHIGQPTKSYSKHYVLGLGFHGFHRINYLEWGVPKGNRQRKDTLICVHGVSRNARDFDYLAESLCDRYRIICPDVVGRGDSDHLVGSDGYTYFQYNADMNALLARLNIAGVDWVGTSMGGIIGMVLAAAHQSPIRRLVLNDIGPFIEREALVKIGEYIGRSGEFETAEDAEKYLREIYSDFGPMTDEDWAQKVRYSTYRTATGRYRMKMDKGVGEAFRDQISMFDVDMWDVWERITCPVLILRGAESTFFTRETAQKMLTCGPEATLVELEGSGHAPTLRSKEQVDVIADWLAQA
ncbi:MAG: alpha/beta hydrolase [Pseudomonadota bacterium]